MLRSLCNPVIKKYNQLREKINRKKCALTEEELTEYQSFTFLSKAQIVQVFWIFHDLDPDISDTEKNPYMEHEKVLRMPKLLVNPFKDRIIKIFSSENGIMYFEEFLEMMSIFSDKAPRKAKIEYAFRIYDFGEDGMIGTNDLEELLRRLRGGNHFRDIDYNEMIENIMNDGDVDADGFMTFPEFQHLLKKCPDFIHSFRIRI